DRAAVVGRPRQEERTRQQAIAAGAERTAELELQRNATTAHAVATKPARDRVGVGTDRRFERGLGRNVAREGVLLAVRLGLAVGFDLARVLAAGQSGERDAEPAERRP